jgi:hypothetical protein
VEKFQLFQKDCEIMKFFVKNRENHFKFHDLTLGLLLMKEHTLSTSTTISPMDFMSLCCCCCTGSGASSANSAPLVTFSQDCKVPVMQQLLLIMCSIVMMLVFDRATRRRSRITPSPAPVLPSALRR